MKRISVRLTSCFCCLALLLAGCAFDNGGAGGEGYGISEKTSAGISENTAPKSEGLPQVNTPSGNTEETEKEKTGDSEDSPLPLNITVNGRSFMPDNGAPGIGYASVNGVIGVMFAGADGSDAAVLTVTMSDQLAYNGSSVPQSDFGQNAVVEILMVNGDTQAMSAGTTLYSASESYIENAVFEVKEYSSDSGRLQITLVGKLCCDGESYSFNASGTAGYSAELEQQLAGGSQGDGNSDPDSCSLCKGSGVCYYCNGRGIKYTIQGQMTCVSCNGDGLCKWCHGRGTL